MALLSLHSMSKVPGQKEMRTEYQIRYALNPYAHIAGPNPAQEPWTETQHEITLPLLPSTRLYPPPLHRVEAGVTGASLSGKICFCSHSDFLHKHTKRRIHSSVGTHTYTHTHACVCVCALLYCICAHIRSAVCTYVYIWRRRLGNTRKDLPAETVMSVISISQAQTAPPTTDSFSLLLG